MADVAFSRAKPHRAPSTAWDRLKVNRDWLGLWFMLPAAAFLLLFLAYPLGLGIWLSFTDARIGRGGNFVGLENYEWLWDDSVFWLSVFNTLLYTGVASVLQIRGRPLSRAFAQPAHALQGDHPRARADPVHRADGAVSHRVLVDLRQPVLDRVLVAAGRSA